MGWLSIKNTHGNSLNAYKKGVLYKSIITALDDKELAKIDVDNLIDSIEQKIISTRKTIIEKNELIKIVLNTIKPVSLSAYIKYLSSHMALDNKRQLNNILKDI